MQLGAFSISLTVKDLDASLIFYETLGFTVFGGDATQGWLILKNGSCVIGLFQGMFDRNTLTFNPGWDSDATRIDGAPDIRDLQKQLEAKGVQFDVKADDSSTGPASFVITDPDGNPILVDQHF